MKTAKILSLILLGFIFFNQASATERIVIAEMFTNTS